MMPKITPGVKCVPAERHWMPGTIFMQGRYAPEKCSRIGMRTAFSYLRTTHIFLVGTRNRYFSNFSITHVYLGLYEFIHWCDPIISLK